LLLHPNLLSPSLAVNLSPAGAASLPALTHQQGVSDAELIDAAIADAEAQYAAMLLNQQDQRCAAHIAQLTVEGWLNPPSTQSADAASEPIKNLELDGVPFLSCRGFGSSSSSSCYPIKP
jgi:hypothetical protein